MSSQSTDATLPKEVDFIADKSATPQRMNRATGFLVAWMRRLESVQPDFLAATAQLKAIGLERLDALLTPILVDAQAVAAQLATIKASWITGAPLTALLADLTAQVTARLTTTDAKIVAQDAAVTQRLADNTTAVTAQITAANAGIAAAATKAERAFITGSF